MDTLLETAVAAARVGGQELGNYFRCDGLRVSTKGDNDFVTNADHASETAILKMLRDTFPGHAILAEESGYSDSESNSEFTWIVDPLDGTRNFAQGLPIYSVSIACIRDGMPVVGVVFDPQREELFAARKGGGAQLNGTPLRISSRTVLAGSFLATGYPFRHGTALDLYLETFRDVFSQARGVRRCGSAALDLAYTAAGIFDGFFEFGLSAWDIAAGALLIEEAGGRISDLDGGGRYLDCGNVVAGAPGVWTELRSTISRHADEERMGHLLGAASKPSAASELDPPEGSPGNEANGTPEFSSAVDIKVEALHR
ncbi:MAG: inositol monophosphatase [Thermoanaerobaculia bacterium]|nr:inositol monophosphatase [Thermoanaerobaculia bacterium]